jgi:uncharacterized protein (TIGR01777 family)
VAATQPILVTGATGLVGRRLVGSLRAAGRAVRVVSRRREPPGFGAGVEIATWNGRDLPRAALAGAGAVVHLAGEPVFGGVPTRAHLERIRASRVDSTEAIVASLAALPQEERPECFVCASAVGYYGSRGDAELDESAPPGDTYLAEVCVAWERAARGAEPLGVRTVMLRTGIVLAREGGALPLMAMPFRFGLGGRLGDGRQWFPWIHVEDEVALVSAALTDPGWSGPVNAVAPSPVTNAELTRALGEVMHRPTLLPVPAFAVRLALGELAGELLGSRRAVPRAALARGFRFAYPELAPALREALG